MFVKLAPLSRAYSYSMMLIDAFTLAPLVELNPTP